MVDELLRASYNDMVRAFVNLLDVCEPGEGDHAERVAVYAVATAEKMGWSNENLVHLRRAALLHDVGKVAIDRNLLRKLGDLDEDDLNGLRLHAAMAESLLSALPWLAPAIPMIRHHHERWDGEGYPARLCGAAIPPGARVIAVAEVFDHVAYGSSYREPMGREEACAEISAHSGTQFDPEVVTAFLKIESVIQPA